MWRELSLGLSGPLSPLRAAQPVGWRGACAVSWASWRAEAGAWYQAFRACPGASVAIHLDDTLSAAAALFAAWQAGKTVWWPGDALPATAARLLDEVDALAGDWGAQPALRPLPGPEPAWSALDVQAPALVVFTSGSSGAPLAQPKQLRQLFDEVHALEAEFGARLQGARVLGTVSHQHIYGLLFRLLWPLAAGRPLVAQRLAYLEDLAGEPGPLALVASPAHLKRLNLAAPLRDTLCALFSSGGPLPDEALAPCAQQLGQTPIEVYGSSETGGVAWRQRAAGDDAQHPWRALPGVEWRIEAGSDTLWLRSPQLGRDDWVAAADRVRAEGPGFVLLGRADRIVKIEEKRVSLAAIEQALRTAEPGLLDLRLPVLPGRRQELGVVLVPSPECWERIEAQGRAAWLAPLKAALEALLEPTVRPRRWRLVSELPCNAQGKTTQAALAALFDPLRPPARLLQRGPQRALLRLEVEARLPAFDGHFPQHPVLPGVLQLDWAERFGRELFAQLLPNCAGLEQLKFQQLIAPGLQLELELEAAADGRSLRFALRSAERGAHASGKLLFAAGTEA